MKVTRYGKQSGGISASKVAKLEVVHSTKDGYRGETRLDITGFAGMERGSMLEVALSEAELRRLLTGIEAKRSRDESRERKALKDRCTELEARLDLIYQLMSRKLSSDFQWHDGPIRARDKHVLEVITSLALHSGKVAAAKRMVGKKT